MKFTYKLIAFSLFLISIEINAESTYKVDVIDSNTTIDSEKQIALSRGFPQAVVDMQTLVTVYYFSFDGKIHQGQLLIDKRLAPDIKIIFSELLKVKFPINTVIPISRFNWDDHLSMSNNNTSGFNYRKINGKNEMSNHAYGQAIDINTFQNPFINRNYISPKGAKYNPSHPGTITKNSIVVKIFTALGWSWGGDWKRIKDFQHFEKNLSK